MKITCGLCAFVDQFAGHVPEKISEALKQKYLRPHVTVNSPTFEIRKKITRPQITCLYQQLILLEDRMYSNVKRSDHKILLC